MRMHALSNLGFQFEMCKVKWSAQHTASKPCMASIIIVSSIVKLYIAPAFVCICMSSIPTSL